jgi:hypothetical protein
MHEAETGAVRIDPAHPPPYVTARMNELFG